MPAFNEGNSVFVNHPDKGWLPGRITEVEAPISPKSPKGKMPTQASSTPCTYSVVDEDGETLSHVKESCLTLCRDDLKDEDVNDLLFLTVLHDATLLRCLKIRYMKDVVYTNIGAIVVALNPFNFKIPRYMDDKMASYLAEGQVIRTNLPHSWAVAHNTYFEMVNDNKNQTVLVSGESGAGKTEACKMVMKYLGQVSMLAAEAKEKEAAEQIRCKILNASPILEGFGNAKTVRNDNSSRFGKFVKIQFKPGGWFLSGAFTVKYLLEKSRIVTAAPSERVYHAFYYLLKGSDAKKYGMRPVAEYKSVNAGSCIDVPGMDDGQDYADVLKAMDTVGISKADQDALWGVVAGCLVSQNVTFHAVGEGSEVDEKSNSYVEHQANLFHVPAADLKREFITTIRETRGETYVVQHKLPVANDMRDSLTKHMYDNVFGWLVDRINETTATEEEGRWIGLLDIFGFEDFKVNSFEQLCINLTNETLQNHYNNYIFTKDIAECKAEGINVTDIVAPDNSLCMKLVLDRLGIMGILDDECALPSGTDAGFFQKVETTQIKNPFFDKPKISKTPCFIVKHYAGDVKYEVEGFVDKNRDNLKDALRLLLRSSSNPFVANLLPAPVERTGKVLTVGGFFRQQLCELMDTLNQTNPHWIRCIKPHKAKKPLMFDGSAVTKQLESSGVLGTVKIRKAGYPVRILYYNFCVRYKILVGKAPAKMAREEEFRAFSSKAVTAAKIELGKLVQLGKTKVFLKSEAYHTLEQARDEASIKHRLNLQAAARAYLAQLKKRRLLWNVSAGIIQDDLRDFFRRSAVVREERRKAREALLAKQKKEREDVCEQQEAEYHELVTDLDDRFGDILAQMKREKQWLEKKIASDTLARNTFAEEEYKIRLALYQESHQDLLKFRPQFIALAIMCVEEVEEYQRNAMISEENQSWKGLFRALEEMMLSGQRVEIERYEKKLRRCLQKIEAMMFEEIDIRKSFFPNYGTTLQYIAKQYGTKILAVKDYANRLERRNAAINAVRERHRAQDAFSKRHSSDLYRMTEAHSHHYDVGGHDALLGVKSPKYTRVGDTTQPSTTWIASKPWVGTSNVPDVDQLLLGCEKPAPRAKGSNIDTSQVGSTCTTTTSSPSPARTHDHNPQADLRPIGVCETFEDRFDELQFLTQRSNTVSELKALSILGMYEGPYVKVTAIPDKMTLRGAQDILHEVVLSYSQQLVKQLRSLETFCISYKIPQQNQVTGEWLPFKKCDPALMCRYPQCTDWRLLESEVKRLKDLIQNYKTELLAIIQSCVTNGARVQGEITEGNSIHEVYALYTKLQGTFLTCKRCLYPMASKDTLVANRISWPRVQCSKMPDRCRTCNTSAFAKPTISDPALHVATKDLRHQRIMSFRKK